MSWTGASKVFVENDPLLRAQATVVIYYLALKNALHDGWTEKFTRDKLELFNKHREENRRIAQENIAQANYDLLEFDRMTQQGTNDKTSIQFRRDTLVNFLRKN